MEKLRKEIFSFMRVISFAIIGWEFLEFVQHHIDLAIAIIILILTWWYDE